MKSLSNIQRFQVVSPATSSMLVELGVSPHTLFWWYCDERNAANLYTELWDEHGFYCTLPLPDGVHLLCHPDPAFTTGELLPVIPSPQMWMDPDGRSWNVCSMTLADLPTCNNVTLPDAVGGLVAEMVRLGFVSAQYVNQIIELATSSHY